MRESINKLKIHKGTYQQIQENMENIEEHDFVFVTDKSVPFPTPNDVGKYVVVNAQGEYTLVHKTTLPSYVFDTFENFKSSLRFTSESPYKLESIVIPSGEEIRGYNIPLGTEIYIAEEDVADYWLFTKEISLEADVQDGLGFFRTIETKPRANAIIEIETLPDNPLTTVFYKVENKLYFNIEGRWHLIQEELTFDEEPIEGSTNPVTSGGLHRILKDGVGGIIDVDKLPQLTGTLLVSNPETLVEKVIFNNKLSIEETVEILSQLTYYDFNGNQASALYSNATATSAIIVTKNSDTDYRINHYTNVQTFTFTRIFSSVEIDGVVGWHNTEYEINQTGVTSLMGLPIGAENEKLITLLSMNDNFTIDVNDKCVYRLRKDELKGTPLPYDATTVVENLYFNTSLSVDEVVSICENNLSKSYTNYITIAPNQSEQIAFNNSYLIGYVAELDVWAIANYAMLSILEGNVVEGAKLLFVSKPVPDLGITFEGWNPDITYPIAYNYPRYTIYAMEENSGFDGELISDLVSTKPFITISTYTYWVYKNKWVQLLTDEIKNEDEYIVIEKKGDFISHPESISFSNAEFDTIQSNNKVLVKFILDESLKAIFYKNGSGEDSYTDQVYLSTNIVAYTYHLLIMRDKTTKEVTTHIAETILINESRVKGFSVMDQGEGPILMLHVLDELGDHVYHPVYLKTEIEKDSIDIPTTGAVYNALDKKLTKSLSDVSSTTNVATTDNMLLNKAGTMYKVTIQELQEVFGSANYKGNFVSVSALPATGTAGDYAFVKAVTDGDTDLIMYIWNDTDKHWEETGTSQYVKNATFQATMATKQDKLDVSLDEKGTMNIVIPESIEGAKTIKVNGVELVPVMEDITWENLKTLRDEGKLIPGKSYKIIDYTCTTSQSNTISAHHDFDIIVTADSTNTLNENARACLKEGDTYFRTAEGGAWTLMPVGWQFVDGRDEENYTGSGSGDIFIKASYAENPHGYNSPVLYKTSYDAYVSGDSDMSLPDYDDPFFYFGTWELDGVVYDRWKKHEVIIKAFTWSSDDTGDIYVLTEQLVQGIPNSSDPNNFDPSNCTFIEEKITPTPIVYEVCNLSAWELKYCLDNDNSRFAWADNTNGKGVIYYMKDEHGNEAWYDFKSIKQKVYDRDFMPTTSLWCRTPLDLNYEGDEYFYTFHFEGDTDLSVKALIGPAYNANIELWHPKNNKIYPYRIRLSTDGEKQTEVLWLPYVIFYTNTLFIDKHYGLFLWENSRVTGSNVLCVGTLWNVELKGTSENGLCGCFVNTYLHVNHDTYFEGTLRGGCTINVLSGITYYKIWNYSRVEGTMCYLQNDPGVVYQYTTNFENPEPLYEETYEEEEE